MNLDIIRPSTLLRVAENGVGSVLSGIAHGGRTAKHLVRGAKHDLSIEMAARSLARAQRRLERDSLRLDTLSQAEVRQVTRDQQAILSRAQELRAKRRAR